jgi:hypothetical protein
MPLGKVDGVTETHHFPQKIGTMTEALQDARHLLAAGLGAPFVVDLRYFAGGVRIFDHINFVPGIAHSRFANRPRKIVTSTPKSSTMFFLSDRPKG